MAVHKMTELQVSLLLNLNLFKFISVKYLNCLSFLQLIQQNFECESLPPAIIMDRNKLIQKLHDKIELSSKLTPSLVAITGPVGVGKSTLAAQYAVKYFKPEHIYWINAETEELCIQAFRDIASSINLPLANKDGEFKNAETLIDQVYRNISTISRTLFVFDNVDTYEELELYLPYQISNIQIVFTSRQTGIQITGLQVLQIDVFSKDDAENFIIKILRNECAEEDTRKLAETLSYNPLALRHALAFIKYERGEQGHYQISDYLLAFKEHQNKAKEIQNNCIETTYFITANKLSTTKSGELALSYLKMLTYFQSQNIFLDIFLKKSETQHNSAIALLRDYGLIRMSTGTNRCISLARSTQDTIRRELLLTNQKLKVLRTVLGLFLYCSDLDVFKRSVQHAMCAWSHAINSKICVIEFHGLPNKIMNALIESGNLKVGKLFCQQTLPILYLILGCDHITTLAMEKKIAKIYFLRGNYTRAVSTYTEVYYKYKRLLGPDHRITINCKLCMAEALYKSNCLHEAERIYALELQRNIRMHGKYHESNFKIKEYLLRVRQQLKGNGDISTPDQFSEVTHLREQGKYKEAIDILQILLEKYPDQPNYIKNKRQLAKLFELKGDYDTALKLNEEILTVKHLDTNEILMTNRQLASVLHQTGKYNEALELYEIVLPQSKSNLDKLSVRRAIASIMASQGHIYKAFTEYNELYAIAVDTFGDEHSYTLTTKRCIAALRFEQGFYAESLVIYESVLNTRLSILGPNHIDHIITRRGIGAALQKLRRFDEALQIFQLVLDQGESTFGTHHPDNDLTKRAIATLLHEQASSKWTDAQQIYKDLLTRNVATIELQQNLSLKDKYESGNCMCQELLSKEPENKIISANQQNALENKYKDELIVYERLLRNGEQVLGEDHPDNLVTKCCIAAVLQEQEKYVEALQAYQEVLDKRSVTLGVDHPDNLVTRRAMAVLLQKQGKYDQALCAFQEIYEKSVSALGPTHADVALTSQHINAVQREKIKYNQVRKSVHEEKKRADNFNSAFIGILLTFVITLMYPLA